MSDTLHLPIPSLLAGLQRAYEALIARQRPPDDERVRLLSVASDFRWYGERLGPARWERPPGASAWSFAAILRHVAEQAVRASDDQAAPPVRYFIDHGKEHVGQVAELWFLLAAEDEQGAG